MMKYEEFIEKFEVEFMCDLHDEDCEGEIIIRPNQRIAVPKEKEMIKKVFDVLNKSVDLDMIEKYVDEFTTEFDNGLKANINRIDNNGQSKN
jgi:hypothetical protein